ncbi:MAG: PIN domain-containing protein [Myxococcales bacterium]|nr:PIN domain-containing protein [Myxococcales bacterium]MCB9709480.1 PIN domain-containing protein [Myxococcales bacterium]
MQLVLRLGVKVLPLSETALLRSADWAHKGLSGYDATCIALAESLNAKWLTADVVAVRKAGRKVSQGLTDGCDICNRPCTPT